MRTESRCLFLWCNATRCRAQLCFNPCWAKAMKISRMPLGDLMPGRSPAQSLLPLFPAFVRGLPVPVPFCLCTRAYHPHLAFLRKKPSSTMVFQRTGWLGRKWALFPGDHPGKAHPPLIAGRAIRLFIFLNSWPYPVPESMLF